MTIAWTLSTIATAAAMTLSGAGFLIVPPSEEGVRPHPLAPLIPLMLFTATITGLVTICLTPLVYFFRRVPPPWIVTAVVVAVAISPLAVLVAFATR